MPQPIDQAIAGHLDQQRPQLLALLECPIQTPQSVDDVGPDRLHDIGGVELRSDPIGHLPANDHPQIGLELEKRFGRGLRISRAKTNEQRIGGSLAHAWTRGNCRFKKSQLDVSSSPSAACDERRLRRCWK